ncbi:C40 family peptidase [Nocardia sp. NPDC057440]|uniref:C40 family peptidase n=1 Tax=Nocardia sp. NPDC057440 TaxID=3346134 RepID=UPI00366AF56E
MASTTDVRYFCFLRRAVLWALAAGAVAFIATLLNPGQASAQPVTIPSVGTFEIPDEISIPADIVAIDVRHNAILPEFEAPIGADFLGIDVRHNAILPEFEAPVGADILGIDVRHNAILPEFETPIGADAVGIEFLDPALVPVIEIVTPANAPGIEPSAALPTPGAQLSLPATIPGMELLFPSGLPRIELPFLTSFPGMTGFPGMAPPAQAAPAVVKPQKTTGEVAVDAARTRLGADYSYGAVGPRAFDCSGLVQWSYEQAGVDVPRTSYGQLAAGTPVPLDDLQPGDLVSFYGGSHSALYAGDGEVIHASTYGTGVTTSPLSSMPVAGARRL